MAARPAALTIAGSDPSGGAGLQADLKTFHQFGVYGEAAVTLVTVQNTAAVTAVELLRPELVAAQIQAVVSDIPPQAAKTGALGNAALIVAVAHAAASFLFPLVVDPVMIGKHGAPLLDASAVRVLKQSLVPFATLLTPNLAEAAALIGRQVSTVDAMREADRALADAGAKNVLVKGGHLAGAAVDVLFTDGRFLELPAPRIATPHTHGTGCTYSAAITALLARGVALVPAVEQAKRWITRAIETNPGLGHGAGPLNHFAPTEP